MEELNQPTGLWAGIGMAVAGLITGALWLFSRFSNLSVERAGDRAEIHIIEVLQAENAKLRELFATSEAEKREYFQKFMEASTQVSLLTEKVTQLNEKVTQQNTMITQQNTMIEELKLSIAHLSQELEKR